MISFLLVFLIIKFLFVLNNGDNCPNDCYKSDKLNRHLVGLSNEEIQILMTTIEKKSELRYIFDNINLIRPVGSDNHRKVREFIENYMMKLQWDVQRDSFTTNTVIGPQKFTNIVATLNPRDNRRLILACHYDSLMKEGFYGSIDSAMPCSIMLDLANIISRSLKYNLLNVTLQLVFFDGEEAFKSWTETDSLYGSRHLVDQWADHWDDCKCNMLSSIEALVLLDLIGAKDTKICNFPNNDFKLFEALSRIEQRFKQYSKESSRHNYFELTTASSYIGDDHVPFVRKGVSTVHLIPVPFPSQWHTNQDNAENIDWKASNDFLKIISIFIGEYFHLGRYLSEMNYSSVKLSTNG